MKLVATIDMRAFQAFASLDGKAAQAIRVDMARIANMIGHKVERAVQPALTAQTGLPKSTIHRAVKVYAANPGKPEFTLWTAGGDISLKYFRARETTAGVSAAPRNARTVFAQTFIKGGRWPSRVTAKRLNGHVYRNVAGGKWGGTIQKVKSGVIIPQDFVRGTSRAVFERIVGADLPAAGGALLRKLVPSGG